MTAAAQYFPGFQIPAPKLLKFISASDYFTIMLINGDIIHFLAGDEELFRQWLLDNKVSDIRKEEGWITE